jgi:hypothetical protein
LDGNQEIPDLTQLSRFNDTDKIGRLFEVKDLERRMESGFHNAIYSKLALKNM